MAACGSCWLWLWWGDLRGFGWAVLDCLSSYDCSTLSLCIWLAAHSYRCESSSVNRVICLICRHPLWKKPQEVVTQLQTFLIINWWALWGDCITQHSCKRNHCWLWHSLSPLTIHWKFHLSGSYTKWKYCVVIFLNERFEVCLQSNQSNTYWLPLVFPANLLLNQFVIRLAIWYHNTNSLSLAVVLALKWATVIHAITLISSSIGVCSEAFLITKFSAYDMQFVCRGFRLLAAILAETSLTKHRIF